MSIYSTPQVQKTVSNLTSRKCLLLLSSLQLLLLIALLLTFYNNGYYYRQHNNHILPVVSEFEGFNNVTGVSTILVPNIIHFIRFFQKEFRFVEAICVLSAVKYHKPDIIYIHTNTNIEGKYWEYLLSISEFKQVYRINKIEHPPSIFGQKFTPGWHTQHGSDVTRIRVLMQFGGIYLDNDCFVNKNLDQYRHFEMSIGWDEEQFLGNQIQIAHPDARFLKLYLESYRDNYRSDCWYCNGGEVPTKTILFIKPELINRVKLLFGNRLLGHELYHTLWKEWKDHYIVHLLINHRPYMDKTNYELFPEFNETNIVDPRCNVTICSMLRDVYFSFNTLM